MSPGSPSQIGAPSMCVTGRTPKEFVKNTSLARASISGVTVRSSPRASFMASPRMMPGNAPSATGGVIAVH